MKLTIPWTPLLAVFTLSLGTLTEGAAIATSPHSPSSRSEHQENLVLAQVFNNLCAVVEQNTGLFPTNSTAQPANGVLNAGTPVRILNNAANGWIQVQEAYSPFRTGYILGGEIGRSRDCGLLPPPQPPRQEFSCYFVTADRLPVYDLPTITNNGSRYALLKNDRVHHINEGLHNGTYVDPNTGLAWLQIRSVITPQNPRLIEGWVQLQGFPTGNRRELQSNMILDGVCN